MHQFTHFLVTQLQRCNAWERGSPAFTMVFHSKGLGLDAWCICTGDCQQCDNCLGFPTFQTTGDVGRYRRRTNWSTMRLVRQGLICCPDSWHFVAFFFHHFGGRRDQAQAPGQVFIVLPTQIMSCRYFCVFFTFTQFKFFLSTDNHPKIAPRQRNTF